MDEPERHQNKNANNKVDALYNSWLERMVLSKTVGSDPAELAKSIQEIKELLEETD